MVRIITDSTCDISQEKLDEIGAICVPLTVYFGDEAFIDGQNLTSAQFYEKLRGENTIPRTAQPCPLAFEQTFRECLERDEDVLCILISSELSGTVQSANIAKNAIESDRIRIIDSKTVCLGLGLLINIVAKKAAAGATMDELCACVTGLMDRTRVYAAVETLEYLKKGGRLSGTAAALGTMLNLHPILTVEDAKVINADKVRGKKRMFTMLADLAEKLGVDTQYPVMFGHGGSEENCVKLEEAFRAQHEVKEVAYAAVGPVVGTYTGPGVVAIAFITAKN